MARKAEEKGQARPIKKDADAGGPAAPAARKRNPHRWKMLPWRPPGPLVERIEQWRRRQEAAERGRWPLSAAIEHLVTAGLDGSEQEDRVPSSAADALEGKLETVSAQLDELAHHTQTIALLIDALGPACVAGPRVMAAWMAADSQHHEPGETAELAEDRILDDLEIVSQNTWSVFRDEAGPEPDTSPAVAADRPLARMVLSRYLNDERPRATERVPWRLEPALLARLDAWVAKEDVSRARGISALTEMGLDVVDGQQALPKHRAALLEDAVDVVRDDVRRMGQQLELLHRRLDVLGSKICGVTEVLAHWQAHDPDLAALAEVGTGPLSPEEREERLLERYWNIGQSVWQAVVDSATESADDDADATDDDPGHEGGL